MLKKYSVVVFVNGCFWHSHKNCKYFKIPKSNTQRWKDKISKTTERDKKAYKKLIDEGWNVIIVWECDLKPKKIEKRLKSLVKEIIS